MRTLLRAAPIATLLVLVACGGASKSVRKPGWVGATSGTVDEDGKWYWQIEKVTSGSGLKRRQAVDQKVKDALVAACKDVKPEDADIVDHFVDDSGAETAIARIDAGKCPDAPESKHGGDGAAAKADDKPKDDAKPAEDAKPADDAKPAAEEAKPADDAKPAEDAAAAPAEEAK